MPNPPVARPKWQTCSECWSWKRFASGAKNGQCRRFPPTVLFDCCAFPTTEDVWWCREFTPREWPPDGDE